MEREGFRRTAPRMLHPDYLHLVGRNTRSRQATLNRAPGHRIVIGPIGGCLPALRAVYQDQLRIFARVSVGQRHESATPFLRRIRHSNREQHDFPAVRLRVSRGVAWQNFIGCYAQSGCLVRLRSGIRGIRIQTAGHILVGSKTEIGHRSDAKISRRAIGERRSCRKRCECNGNKKGEPISARRHEPFSKLHR